MCNDSLVQLLAGIAHCNIGALLLRGNGLAGFFNEVARLDECFLARVQVQVAWLALLLSHDPLHHVEVTLSTGWVARTDDDRSVGQHPPPSRRGTSSTLRSSTLAPILRNAPTNHPQQQRALGAHVHAGTNKNWAANVGRYNFCFHRIVNDCSPCIVPPCVRTYGLQAPKYSSNNKFSPTCMRNSVRTCSRTREERLPRAAARRCLLLG